MMNPTVKNLPAWAQVLGTDKLTRFWIRTAKHKRDLMSFMQNDTQGVKMVQCNLTPGCGVLYTFAQWKPLTAKMLLPSNLDFNRLPILRSPNKKIGLPDICRE